MYGAFACPLAPNTALHLSEPLGVQDIAGVIGETRAHRDRIIARSTDNPRSRRPRVIRDWLA